MKVKGLIFLPVVLALCLPPLPGAQEMQLKAQAVPSTTLTLSYQGRTLTFASADLAAMPHTTVNVLNAHTKTNETYSGVLLDSLLAKLGVPQGEAVRGPQFLIGVIAEGTDGYQVLYSLAEIDPAIHTGQVIVADREDGKAIADDGAFKLVSTEEKRPARWVRNLTRISVVIVNP